MLTGHVFFFNDTATTEIYTLSLHDALPICWQLQSVASTATFIILCHCVGRGLGEGVHEVHEARGLGPPDGDRAGNAPVSAFLGRWGWLKRSGRYGGRRQRGGHLLHGGGYGWSTINGTNFTLSEQGSGTPVAAAVSYDLTPPRPRWTPPRT